MRQHMKRFTALVMMIAMLVTMFPTGAFAQDENDPSAGAGTETKITGMTLSTADGATEFDLISQPNITLDGFTSYTLTIKATLDLDAEDKHLTVTLPEGMKYLGLDAEALKNNYDTIAQVEWNKGESIYDGVYQPDNGTVDITFTSDAASVEIDLVVQPDMAFYPPNSAERGFTIAQPIGIKLLESNTSKSDHNVTVKVGELDKSNIKGMNVSVWSGNNHNVTQGETFDTGNTGINVHYFSDSNGYIDPLVDWATVSLSVPAGITFVESEWGTPKIVSESDGSQTWTFKKENYHRNAAELGLVVKISNDAEVGTKYQIKLKEIKAKYHSKGEIDSSGTRNNTLWTLTVIDPNEVILGIKGFNYKIHNFTNTGNDDGTFQNYNQLFGGVKITNDGAGAIEKPLVYEASFEGQDKRTVTAVAIPCNWPEQGPTEITVWDEEGTEYELTGDQITEAASLATNGYGFVLRAKDISNFGSHSIAAVKAELPGLPKDYESNENFQGFEGGGINDFHAGAWGRINYGVEDGTVFTNKFRIYEADESPSEWTETTTTVTDNGQIPGSDALTNTTTATVDGEEEQSTSVAAGQTMHISQKISPNNYHDGRQSDTIILDPVVYIMEPEGLDLQNVEFSIVGSTEPLQPSEQNVLTNENLPEGHAELPEGWVLHEYKFSNLVIGWWSGDWRSTQMQVDFDYYVSRTARSASYNMNELVLFKSSLDMEFRRKYVNDIYHLNTGNSIGSAISKMITVNTVSKFDVVGQIKMEGESNWYEYDPNQSNQNIAAFESDQNAQVKISVLNNTPNNADGVIVYVPVPKQGLDLGEVFGMTGENQFDMYAENVEDVPDGWTVQYGTVTGEFDGKNANNLTLKDGTNWQNTPTNETNIIKITLDSGELEPGESAEIILNFSATGSSEQSNRINYFKSWYQYQYGSNIKVDQDTTPNFACQLLNGDLSGVVYIDSNRNGMKDDGEPGKSGVTVEVKNAAGTVNREKTTGQDGSYSFGALPSDEALTVTIRNPGSPDASAGNADHYRFSEYKASSNEVIGTDVIAAENGRSASATVENLNNTNEINAGLIEPYTVTLTAEEDRGSVQPETVYVFPGETLASGLGSRTVQVKANAEGGWSFAGTWSKKTDGGNPSNVENDKLTNETITQDGVTYTANFVAAPAGTISGDLDITLHTPTAQNPNQTELTVGLTNSGDLTGETTYQWQVKKKSDLNWSDVADGTGSSLTISDLTMADDEAEYRCKVTNSGVTTEIGPVELQIEKGTQNAPNVSVTQPTEIGDTGSIGVGESKLDTTMEYRVQGEENWTAVTDEIANNGLTNIEQGAVYEIRYAETEYLNASAVQTITIDTVQGYTVTVAEEDHAKVTASPTTAKVGDKITVTIAEFDAGYELGDTPVTVKTNGENPTSVEVTPGANNTFTFDMPASDVTVTASIVPITYKITYDLNDGNTGTAQNHENNPSTYTVETDDITLQAPTRDGYEFTGWTWKVGDGEQTTNPEMNPEMNVTIPGEFVGDLTFTAHWTAKEPEQYTVTFNAGDHGTIDDDGKTVKVTAGDKLSKDQIPTVESDEDHRFTGWSYEITDGESVVVTDLTTITINGDMTFIAQYEEIQYFTVVIENGGDNATGAGQYEVGDSVTVNAGSKAGYSFAGWEADGITLTEKQKTSLTINFNMPENNVTLTATWEQIPAGTIKVAPASITIYMGGEQGYEGVVNNAGEIEASSSLPEPGFTVGLPEGLSNALAENGDDLTDLTFAEATENEAETSKTWKFESYDGQTNTVYKLVPQGDDQEPTRVQFKKSDNTVVVSSDFNLEDAVNQTLTMELYKGNVGSIVVEYDGQIYTVNSDESATLTVRGTTSSAQYADADVDAAAGQPALGTNDATFTINGSNVKASDDVALLFDEIIGEERETQLTAKAESVLGTANGERSYEFKYLDLVDRGNADAWVTASNNVTVYWPLPTEAVATDTVKVLHFTGLHRENSNNDIPSAIESCTVETIQDARVENGYVVFDIGSGGFSPFALVWETAAEQPSVEKYTIEATAGHGGKISPAGAVTVDEGENQTFTISANSGYSIADVVVDGVSVGAVDSYTFEDVKANHTINVTFERDYTPPPYDPGDPDPEPEPDDPEPDEPDTPDDLNTVDHFSYVVGYEDGTVMPQKQITRAEVATIFYRLLKAEVRDENTTDVSDFSDVKSSDWYGTTVATLAEMNILKGYEDGTFRPNAPITRAEFAAIATRFFDETGATYEPGTFTDVTGSEWFAGAIMDAVNLGLIGGYEDGTVRPNNNITRAEACAIVNRTLGRVPDADHLLPEDEMKTWPDNPESAWFYADMQEATNGHEYEWITEDGNKVENWIDLLDKEWNDR